MTNKSDTTIDLGENPFHRHGWNDALERAALYFEQQHIDGPLAQFNGKWVADELRGMKHD